MHPENSSAAMVIARLRLSCSLSMDCPLDLLRLVGGLRLR